MLRVEISAEMLISHTITFFFSIILLEKVWIVSQWRKDGLNFC